MSNFIDVDLKIVIVICCVMWFLFDYGWNFGWIVRGLRNWGWVFVFFYLIYVSCIDFEWKYGFWCVGWYGNGYELFLFREFFF